MTSPRFAAFASTLIGLIVVVLVWLCFPATTYSPRGVFLPSSLISLNPIKVEQVELYKENPLAFSKVGTINIEHHVNLDDQTEAKILFDYAKAMAAERGANGVVIKNLFRSQPTGSQAPLAAFILYADAISTPISR